MKKTFSNTIKILKENKWFHYCLIIIIGVILSIPLKDIQISETHDGFVHLLRIFGTSNTLKIGEFPPIVAPYFCSGGGYAMNLFYNPLVTYIPLLIKLFTTSYAIALKIFAGMCIVLSGITMYKFVYEVTKNRAISLFASIIYLIAPYKLGDVYKRFAIGEFASFIFIPILFKGIYSLFNQDGKKHYYIAIGAIGLILTHTITTFYTVLYCIIYVLFNIKKLKEKEVIKKLVINVIFILLVSLFFIAPLVEAKFSADYAILDNKIMSTNGRYVYDNTLKISEFFKNKDEQLGGVGPTTYIIGIPTFILAVLSIITYRKIDKKYKDFYILAWLFAFIGLFMSCEYCPWHLFPDFFCKLQYPWRMMTFFVFFISFIDAVNLYIILGMISKKDFPKIILSIVIITTSVAYTVPIVQKYKTKKPNLDEANEKYVTEKPYINVKQINREYLPIKALKLQNTYLLEKEDRICILQGSANITQETKKDLTLNASIEDILSGTILEMPFFYYPGYEVIIEQNENKEKLNPVESENGFVSVKLENNIENCTISIKYVGTAVIYVSYAISFISFIGFVIYIIYEAKKVEKD